MPTACEPTSLAVLDVSRRPMSGSLAEPAGTGVWTSDTWRNPVPISEKSRTDLNDRRNPPRRDGRLVEQRPLRSVRESRSSAKHLRNDIDRAAFYAQPASTGDERWDAMPPASPE